MKRTLATATSIRVPNPTTSTAAIGSRSRRRRPGRGGRDRSGTLNIDGASGCIDRGHPYTRRRPRRRALTSPGRRDAARSLIVSIRLAGLPPARGILCFAPATEGTAHGGRCWGGNADGGGGRRGGPGRGVVYRSGHPNIYGSSGCCDRGHPYTRRRPRRRALTSPGRRDAARSLIVSIRLAGLPPARGILCFAPATEGTAHGGRCWGGNADGAGRADHLGGRRQLRLHLELGLHGRDAIGRAHV